MTQTVEVDEARARYGRIAEGFDRRVTALGHDDWSARTPCTEWDVRALLTHVVGVHRRVGSMLEGVEPTEVGPEEDLVAAWRTARAVVETAMADREVATRVVDTRFFGSMPFAAVVGGLLSADTLIHTWDLSRATGQDERLDPAAVSVAFGMLRGIGDAIRSPTGFGPPLEPAADADEQAQLLAFCGRTA